MLPFGGKTLDHAALLLPWANLSVDEVSDAAHFTLAWCQAMGALLQYYGLQTTKTTRLR